MLHRARSHYYIDVVDEDHKQLNFRDKNWLAVDAVSGEPVSVLWRKC